MNDDLLDLVLAALMKRIEKKLDQPRSCWGDDEAAIEARTKLRLLRDMLYEVTA